MRCTNDGVLDALVGRLMAFEFENFDNYSPNLHTLKSAFKAKLNLGKKKKKKKKEK